MLLAYPRHHEPPLGGVAIQNGRTISAIWIVRNPVKNVEPQMDTDGHR